MIVPKQCIYIIIYGKFLTHSASVYNILFSSPVYVMLQTVPTLRLLQNLERGQERLRLVSELIPYWEELAYELDFPACTIEEIKLDNRRSYDQCQQMLSTWLGPRSPSRDVASWGSLITAMRNIDLRNLANTLEGMVNAVE